MVNNLESIENRLNKLDCQYLTGYPSELKREDYLTKRAELKTEFKRAVYGVQE